MVVVDTSILIGIDRGKLSPRFISEQIHDKGETPVISAVTYSEMLAGIHRAKHEVDKARREHRLGTLIKLLPILPFTAEVARVHARLGYYLEHHGGPIGAHDLIIAATAVAHSATIMSADLRSFPRVPDLPVIAVQMPTAKP